MVILDSDTFDEKIKYRDMIGNGFSGEQAVLFFGRRRDNKFFSFYRSMVDIGFKYTT